MADNFYLIANQLVNNPKYRPILAIIKGFRNGVVYGCKIRFPHALVMTFLFSNATLIDKIKAILMATFTHAKNLASFVTIYKVINYLLGMLPGKRTQRMHYLIAAFCGSYYVFGEKNSINEQINLYVLSRVLIGVARLGQEKGILPTPKRPMFAWYTAIIWTIGFWLFETNPHVLQHSLKSSMTYLYVDSNKWNSLKNFIFYNK